MWILNFKWKWNTKIALIKEQEELNSRLNYLKSSLIAHNLWATLSESIFEKYKEEIAIKEIKLNEIIDKLKEIDESLLKNLRKKEKNDDNI